MPWGSVGLWGSESGGLTVGDGETRVVGVTAASNSSGRAELSVYNANRGRAAEIWVALHRVRVENSVKFSAPAGHVASCAFGVLLACYRPVRLALAKAIRSMPHARSYVVVELRFYLFVYFFRYLFLRWRVRDGASSGAGQTYVSLSDQYRGFSTFGLL